MTTGRGRAGGNGGRLRRGSPFRSGPEIGVALGADGLTAVVGQGKDTAEMVIPFELPQEAQDAPAILALAFEELHDRLRWRDRPDGSVTSTDGEDAPPHPSASVHGAGPSGPGRVTVALLPPLCETRLLKLPPIEPHEAEEVVRRTADQHFLTGGAPSVVAVTMPRAREDGGDRDGARALALASAAPRAMTDALYHAVTSVGWSLDAIVPGHGAWLTALGEARDRGATSAPAAPRLFVACVGGTAHLMRIEGDALTAVRRVPTSSPRDVTAAAGPGPGRMWVLGTGSERNSIMDGLTATGWHAGPQDRVSGTPARLAAEWAARTDMELVPPRLAMERRDRIRRTGATMGAAAVILVVAAAGLQLWGARREVDAIRERRAEIREAVTPVLAAASELVAIEERLAAIEEIQEASGSWTFALVELSVVLPDDVHLLALQAAGDTLVIDAVGRRAGDALDALRRAASLRDVRQEGPTQYELEDGSVARERFTLSAIRVPDAAPTSTLGDPGGAQ